jgi:two-component system sensor histidine kinase HydH
MRFKNKFVKASVIALLIAAILSLHYLTLPTRAYYHAVYRMLFYLPLIMAGFWFGLKGALSVCGSVLVLFSPYVVMRWQGLSLEEFDTLLEGFLYIAAAFILGFLAEREKKAREARIAAERLAAIGKAVSEVAHDMKTPLMAAEETRYRPSRNSSNGIHGQGDVGLWKASATRADADKPE